MPEADANDTTPTPPPGGVAPLPSEAVELLLAALPVLAGLPAADIARLARSCATVLAAEGEVLLREGEHGDHAFVIVNGEADVLTATPFATIRIAAVGPGEVVGELGILCDSERTATVVARSPMQLIRLDRAAVQQAVRENPQIAISMLAELGRRLHGLNKPLAYLIYAAEALGRDEYDPAVLKALDHQAAALTPFAEVFSRMASEIQAKRNQRQELEVAARIQRAILPSLDTLPANVEAHAAMHPARSVGGDFYDLFEVAPGRIAVVIADVSGKGVPAALLMAVARTVVRSVARTETDPGRCLTRANRIIAEQNREGMFVSLFLGMLDLSSGALAWSSAGHNPAHLRRADGSTVELPAQAPALAILDELPYPSETVTLAPGDLLFLYTDGLTDALAADRSRFGDERLAALLTEKHTRPARELVDEVVKAVEDFSGGSAFDDLTVLALRYRGA